MKNKLVSIIVPVYNTAKYLPQCIESLLNQTYKNIEVLFINDGSTDNSLEILQKCKDKRIKIINQKNQGANLARTNGLVNCHGDYVMFIDSDDYILKETIKELMDIINEKNADIVKFDYINYDLGGYEQEKSFNKEQILTQLLTTTKFNNITNEIISKKIIHLNDDVFQIKSSNAEDLLMNLSFFDHSNNIQVINNKYYYYTINDNSTTKTLNIERILSSINEYDVLLDMLMKYALKWNLKTDEVVGKIYYRNITGICSHIMRILECKRDSETIGNINMTLDKAKFNNYDYKKIIHNNEKHLLNRLIYCNLLKRRFLLASLFIKIKKLIKKIIR